MNQLTAKEAHESHLKARNPMGELMLSAKNICQKKYKIMQIIFVIFILIMKVSNLHVPFDVSNLGPSLHLHSQVEDGVLDLDRNLHVLPIYEKSKKA